MKLEKTFFVDGTRPYRNMGTTIPPWNNDYKNISNWYKNSDFNFFYNIVNNEDVYIQYGQDISGWASARFLKQNLVIIDEITNSDGSITATIEVQSDFFKGYPNLVGEVSWLTDYDVRVNNVSQYIFQAPSRADFSYGGREKQTFTINVLPQETNTQGAFNVNITYPNGEAPDNIFTVGFGLYNPNPKTYVPMSIRKNGTWKKLNDNNGTIKRRINGTWVDKSNEDINTQRQVNKGKNRIRRSGEFRQIPLL